MDIVELDDVSYSYNNNFAIKNINMHIKKGELIYLIGENGAGKSTLLLILSALFVPTRGTARIYGKVINEKVTKDLDLRKKIGIVFQDPDIQLFSPTVYDDVAFAPRHLTKENYDIMAREAMEVMNIKHLKNRHPYELSEGEKKRVAIASVLSYNPDFILFDEPTANMDGRGRREFKEIIKKLKNEGKTIVIATHLLMDIVYASRVIIMYKGKIDYDGDPSVLDNKKYLEEINVI